MTQCLSYGREHRTDMIREFGELPGALAYAELGFPGAAGSARVTGGAGGIDPSSPVEELPGQENGVRAVSELVLRM